MDVTIELADNGLRIHYCGNEEEDIVLECDDIANREARINLVERALEKLSLWLNAEVDEAYGPLTALAAIKPSPSTAQKP